MPEIAPCYTVTLPPELVPSFAVQPHGGRTRLVVFATLPGIGVIVNLFKSKRREFIDRPVL